jgi:hypothetical protein
MKRLQSIHSVLQTSAAQAQPALDDHYLGKLALVLKQDRRLQRRNRAEHANGQNGVVGRCVMRPDGRITEMSSAARRNVPPHEL